MAGISKKKICCLGFSANPPHLGHLGAAMLVLRKKMADEVWLIPCFEHSFGKPLIPARHRWKMAKLMEGPRIKASRIELRRRRKSYTIDTVRSLKKQHPAHEFFWMVGADIIKTKSYLNWRNWKELSREIKFIVIKRPGFAVKKLPRGFILAGGASPKISSTEIRERIRRRVSIRGLVPQKVKEYIENNMPYIHLTA
ncbi:MAG: nicotinate (nicotinamide) nucleotide adenylyltransferase [Candidatus Wildermuthbacteria bacterium RIFCSPHIGHO2_01_FULL_47_27]|uniref:Probable nicotinate-nucleotide adenylyltransferase n=2 Tax=Candidatus Wildermuthiibacteriota TaxID=1817923 RepID=A0A1G2RU76_9BACT|nr:MAG: putative nicotinate-nucleotide adenylyltransferase [Parcubacteria group bacterium GW2011_GWA2_47_9]OHA63338.1 MAG: nicotinate (nicotinamide) nucleotide adenylyltransferase [Candidatus Wildermuthbacteria bacterium RIFCSPHIGHO2_01_FULL_47_27]OHA66942.1 MAG: nicotinate (nicotinamide) nucleotide adenylyltransferase [Candidatus Wildermuthbacteria bacterium RIFCSPHIGHO2_02_FULL_47_17]OHA75832.1 MAG: nicotinate (nicotinamide) nucleotide adenylyltransferase [Candidatus Wildermuthbacteria bacteri